MKTYRLIPDGSATRQQLNDGGVLGDTDTIIFRCPCGIRQVCVKSPPHTITFADDLLTIAGSVGSNPEPELGRGKNWCHFDIKNGTATMYADAKCPGRSQLC